MSLLNNSNLNSNLGLGCCVLGTTFQFGFGSTATTNASSGVALEDVNGVQQDAPFIDLTTNDYIIDDNGQILGQSSIAAQVQLAMATTQGSSAVTTLGQQLKSIKVIDSTTLPRLKSICNKALYSLISNNKITINSIVPVPNSTPGRISFTLNWTDLTTGTSNSFLVGQ